MGPARSHVHCDLLVPAAVPGPVGGRRDRQTAVRRRSHFAVAELDARAEPNPAIRQLHSERTNAGGSARPLRPEILPPVRPVARTADPPALVGRGDHGRAVRRVAAGHGSHAAKFFPEPRQALFSGRLFPARRLQYPGYGTEHNAARRVVVTATVR